MRNPLDVIDIAETVGLKTWDAFVARACCDKKEVFLNGGWRGGKSSSGAFLVFIDIITKWLVTPGSHLVWLVGPDYAQARQEYFYLQEWSTRLGLAVESSTAMQGPLTMTIGAAGMPGKVEVATKQAGDPTSLGSVAPVVILACEAGQFSEEAMLWLYGRTAEKNATLIWSGTFENETGAAQYAWFEEASERAWISPTPRQQAFRLPTWENMSLYESCSTMTTDDPSLTSWCPPHTEHGKLHSGLNHPMIRKLADQWKDRPRDWRKRFGGEAVGVGGQVYEWSNHDSWEHFEANSYLVSMSKAQERHGAPFVWLRTAGGMDFGTVHPSAITLGSVNTLGDTWVRRSLKDTSGAMDWIWATKQRLTREYNVSLWGADPMVKYNPTFLEAEAMSGSLYAREARVGIVNGVQQAGHLFFDSDDAGVVLLFREMQRVHRRKNALGQAVYQRVEDDMTASFEDMMAMHHGQPRADLPAKMGLRRPVPRRQYSMAAPRRGL